MRLEEWSDGVCEPERSEGGGYEPAGESLEMGSGEPRSCIGGVEVCQSVNEDVRCAGGLLPGLYGIDKDRSAVKLWR